MITMECHFRSSIASPWGTNGPDKSLFYQRIIKEAVHELGHAFGLKHCNTLICVMHFSNSLSGTDIKQNSCCDICRTRI